MAFEPNYDDRFLNESENLADLNNVATARTNLGLVAGGAGDIWVEKAGDTMTGQLVFDGVVIDITTIQNQDLTLKPHGSGTLELQAGSGGVVISTEAGNSDISLFPHGSGDVNLNDTLVVESDGSAPGADSYSIIKFDNGDRIYSQRIVDRMFYTSDRFEVLSRDGTETIVTFNSSNSANADRIVFYKGICSASYAGTAPPANGAIFSGPVGFGTNSPSGQVHVKGAVNTFFYIDGPANFGSTIFRNSAGTVRGYIGYSAAGGYITNSLANGMHIRGEEGITFGDNARQISAMYYDGANTRLGVYDQTRLSFGYTTNIADPKAEIYYNDTDNELILRADDTGGTLKDALIIDDNTNTKVINSNGVRARVGGVLKVDLDEVGNVGVGEDDLITYSLPANTLEVKGDTVRITAYGRFAANGVNKQVKLYFGSTVIEATGAGTPNGSAWKFEAVVSMDSAGNQKAGGSSQTDGTSFTDTAQYATPAEDETGAITIKCTGEATNNNDIIQEGLIVEYLPNNT